MNAKLIFNFIIIYGIMKLAVIGGIHSKGILYIGIFAMFCYVVVFCPLFPYEIPPSSENSDDDNDDEK
jgi:hypothetical protein